MFRGASILSRVRAPALTLAAQQRGAASPASKRSILTLLGRVGRPSPNDDPNCMEAGDEGAAAAAAAAAAVYGLYDGYTTGG